MEKDYNRMAMGEIERRVILKPDISDLTREVDLLLGKRSF